MFGRCIITLMLLAPLPTWAALPAVKVSITQNGIYGITQPDLAALGIATAGLNPDRFRITHGGRELAIWVTGAGDTRFDLGDGILFYATGIPRGDPRYAVTDEEVYWLWLDGAIGSRMAVAAPATLALGNVGKYTQTVFKEENSTYLSTLEMAEGDDRWLWGNRIGIGERRNLNFDANAIATGTHVDVQVQLLGITDDRFFTPDHRTRIWLNSCLVDDASWDGIQRFTHHGRVAPSCLVDGLNTLSVESVGGGGVIDSIQVDWFEVAYARYKEASNDVLVFSEASGVGSRIVTLRGFSNAVGVMVLDITDAAHPRQVSVDPSGFGRLAFEDSFSGAPKNYIAAHPNAFLHPNALVVDVPSSLTDTANGADLIIITHREMIAGMQPLASYRRQQGLRVIVVDVEDIYDEFSYGVSDPQAIKDFLTYAYQSWVRPKPLYVLLAGDGTVNFKWQFAGGSPNYVPTHFYKTADGGTAPSDHWFVTVDGNDPLPDMLIGRLPVTPTSVVDTVAKIIPCLSGWLPRPQDVVC